MSNPDTNPNANPYLEYAERSQRKHRKPKVKIAQSDADAPMKLTGAEKAMAEREMQLAHYVAEIKAAEQAILKGPHAVELKMLPAFLYTMTLSAAPFLLHGLEAHGWYLHLDSETRRVIFRMIDNAICRCRVRNGLAPMDDPLPGEPDNVFRIVREQMGLSGG